MSNWQNTLRNKALAVPLFGAMALTACTEEPKKPGLTPPHKSRFPQTTHIDNIKAGPEGKVDLSSSALLEGVYDKNDHIVFPEGVHGADDVPFFLAQMVPVLKKKGVECLYLERDKAGQASLDQFMTSGDQEQLRDALNPTNFDAEVLLLNECRKYGLRVKFNDIPLQDTVAKQGFDRYANYQKQNGRMPTEAEMAGPDWEAFKKERNTINQKWADQIKEDGFRKTASVIGVAHVNNMHASKDLDEQIADFGSCVTIGVLPNPNAAPVIYKGEEAAGLPPEIDVPEFIITMSPIPFFPDVLDILDAELKKEKVISVLGGFAETQKLGASFMQMKDAFAKGDLKKALEAVSQANNFIDNEKLLGDVETLQPLRASLLTVKLGLSKVVYALDRAGDQAGTMLKNILALTPEEQNQAMVERYNAGIDALNEGKLQESVNALTGAVELAQQAKSQNQNPKAVPYYDEFAFSCNQMADALMYQNKVANALYGPGGKFQPQQKGPSVP